METVKKVIYYDPECGISLSDPFVPEPGDEDDCGPCPYDFPDVVFDVPVELIENLRRANGAVDAAEDAITKFVTGLGYDTEGSWGGKLVRVENLDPERRRDIRYRAFCDRHSDEYRVYFEEHEKKEDRFVTVEEWALLFCKEEWFETVEKESI